MKTFSELIGQSIIWEPKDRNTPRVEVLSAPIEPNTQVPHGQYEVAVFNFLLSNKGALGLKAVKKFQNLLIDGGVDTLDGKHLTVEVKYRMNWEKACQAEWQFRTFLERTNPELFSADGGIVIFEEFSGDWDLKASGRRLKNGWSRWYESHSRVDHLCLDLLQFRNEKLEGFEDARNLDL